MRSLFVALTLAVGATHSAAQVTMLDAGTFTLYQSGERVGREQFTIARIPQGSGFAIRATATVTMGTRQVIPAVLTDTNGVPRRYQREVRDSGRVQARIAADLVGRRFTVQAFTDSGRAERELPVDPGSVILDSDVVHHHFFAARRAPGRVPILAPGRRTNETVTIESRGTGPVEVGNGTLPSRHLIVTHASGQVTDLWVDDAGRVLRLAVPSRGFVAVRDEPPQ